MALVRKLQLLNNFQNLPFPGGRHLLHSAWKTKLATQGKHALAKLLVHWKNLLWLFGSAYGPSALP